ncbi:MAG TPA: transglutaminase-like domain-containing protein [Solirubrobacteraceae bacterium]|nr:transglutaminase-like domain-containing protein [Solirubrobacteraceae bacterium]
MSTQAAAAPSILAGQVARRPANATRLWPRAVSFLALAAFASLIYGGLVISPPGGRLLAVSAIATAGSASLGLRRRDGRALLGLWPLRLLVLAVTLVLCVLALGVPAHLLAPHGWSRLGHDLTRGTDGLGAWLWPYRGGREWTRLAVLLIVPVTLVVAGGLCFWPARAGTGRGGEVRRSLALALLVALFLTGAANISQPEPGLRGLVLLVLIAAWLWLPALNENEIIRAGRWLVLCALLALAGRAALGSPAPWLGFREALGAEQSASFQWDQVYGPIDWSRSTATMFSVAAARPGLMRVTSLDRFDGLRFLRSDAPPGLASLDLSTRALGALLRARPRPVGAGAHVQAEGAGIEHATVTVAGLRSSLLVGATGLALDVRWMAHGSPVLQRAADGTLTASRPLPSGGVYTVTSYRPRASAAALRRAPRVFPRSYLPYARFELPGHSASGLARPRFAAEARSPLPAQTVGAPSPGRTPASDPAMAARVEASPYGPMFSLARGLAKGAPSSYDVAERIERYLLANYTYDEHVPQARYPLEAFLFQQRRGYCQQFSGAMTLMLRMDGIPARVGSGFKPTVYDATMGTWRVRPVDAHSWVEVFFSGVGWVSFDPTPAAPGKPTGGSGGQSKSIITGGRATAGGSAAKLAATSGSDSAAHHGAASPLPVPLWALVAGLLGLVAAAVWLTAHLRLRRALAGDGEVTVAELRSALSLLEAGDGLPTLAALERRLAGEGREEAARYLAALRARRYGAVAVLAPSVRGRGALRRALRPSLREPHSIRAALGLIVAMPPAALRRRRSAI